LERQKACSTRMYKLYHGISIYPLADMGSTSH